MVYNPPIMAVYSDEVWFNTLQNSGSSNMVVNGSVTPVHFDVAAPAGGLIRRINLLIIDGVQTPTKFAGLAALTNGLEVLIVDDDEVTLVDFLDGERIKKNADWVLLAGIDNPVTAAAGDDEFAVRWTLANGLGGLLHLRVGEKLRVTVNDDLTGITSFRMLAQGVTQEALQQSGLRSLR